MSKEHLPQADSPATNEDEAPAEDPGAPGVPAAGRGPLKAAVKDYLTGRLSRRSFLGNAAALGLTVGSAGRISEALAETASLEDPQEGGDSRIVEGRGGDVYLEQLKECGVEFVFTNPSTGSAPIFDAMLGRDDMHVIMCPQEGPLAAMATGYAKASGKAPYVTVARLGFPNTLVNMFNGFRDRVPMIVGTDQVPEASRGTFSFQEVDDLIKAAEPYSRWRWETRRADSIAADIRRSFKFAMTPPAGPVFLSVPEDLLFESTQAKVVDISRFTLSDQIRADEALVDAVAKRLIAAESPLLYVGDDVYLTGAETAVVALAELLSIPTVHPHELWHWANNFPTDHALYLGQYQANMRYPKSVDLVLNLGGSLPVPGDLPTGAELIEVRSDLEKMGRVYPGAYHVPANVRLFTEDLIEAVRKRAGRSRIRAWRDGRGRATADFARRVRQSWDVVLKSKWDEAPISVERLGHELAALADPDAIIVSELDGGRPALKAFTYGRDKHGFFTTTGTALGWALGAAAGVKMAQPDRQVFSLLGDGTFLFGGSQALWSMKRYQVPVISVVFNNQSYDNERSRIWAHDSRQADAKKDMTCFLGDPDVDYTHLARAYGVEAARVLEPDQLRPAIERAIEVTRDGQPFLIDVRVARRGLGKDVTWYPKYSVARRT